MILLEKVKSLWWLEEWHVVLVVGNVISGWPELPLVRDRMQLVQGDASKAVSYQLLSLSTTEIAGLWRDSVQCLALAPSWRACSMP